ncbi:MAG: hypothetical protein ACLPSH_04745 [Vulcanimicrobiaceae bacterium]
MDPNFRAAYNAAYTPERYAAYRADLERRAGAPVDFRLAETPAFFPPELIARCERTACEIVAQLEEPQRLAPMRAAVPPRWDAPNMSALPSTLCVDLAIVRGRDGALEPKLVELQGFPSLFAFECMQHDAWEHALQTVEGCDRPWSSGFDGRDRAGYLELARRTIVGGHEPAHVVLLDLEPEAQKTYADFRATKKLFDVDALCPTKLIKRGRRLFRRDAENRELPVERIYHRLIIDELEHKKVALPFDLREELDVEWAPHPNWFWVWSKYSLPFLDHPAVPVTRLLSDVSTLPEDLGERYVLKPLFSFAGSGVNITPTRADVEDVPPAERGNWCLQEKFTYAEAIEAVDGGSVKVELRVMFLRPDDEPQLIPAINLCRLSRGAMLGVDYNKDRTWVGSTIGLWPA